MVEIDAGMERSMKSGSSRRDQSSINLISFEFRFANLSIKHEEFYLSKCSSSAVGYRLNRAKADANNERALEITMR